MNCIIIIKLCYRGKSCSWSGRPCVVWGTAFLAMTPSITPWTLWSRVCPVSWTAYTLWIPNADRTEGYISSQKHTNHVRLHLKSSNTSVTWWMMSQQMTLDCLSWVIGSSSRKNLNHQGAEPTRQTVTPGHRAQVRQTKSLLCLGFVILCTISTLPAKSYCAVQLHRYVWRALLAVRLEPFSTLVVKNCVCCFHNYFQKWHTPTAARGWIPPFPLKCSTSLIARSLRFWLTSQKGENKNT